MNPPRNPRRHPAPPDCARSAQDEDPAVAGRASDRRRWLQAALAAALPWSGAGRSWAQTRFERNPFALGVASGSVTHDSTVLWTRLHDQGLFGSNLPRGPIPVRWEIATDERFAQVLRSGVAQALPELAHSVHVEVAGLPSDQWFFYRFAAGEALSATGRTRTLAAPEAAPARLRLAYASCQRYDTGYFNAYAHMAQEDLDLVLFLGDYIYEYPAGRQSVRQMDGTWCLTLDDYRRRYALYRKDPDLQAMHAQCPWLLTWDDHEVQNDYAGLQSGDGGPFVSDFAARRASAYQAYYEHMPLPTSMLTQGTAGLARGAELRLYAQHRHGQLLSLCTLDMRQYRDPQVCPPEPGKRTGTISIPSCPELPQASRTLLGAAQEQWLQGRWPKGGHAKWHVLAQSTLLMPRVSGTEAEPRIWTDGWDGYPAARERLLQWVRGQQFDNFVVFGGDIHSHWVGHVPVDVDKPAGPALGVEFCGIGIASPDGQHPSAATLRRQHPHVVYANGRRRGYGVAEFTPQHLTVSLRAVEDTRQPKSAVETLASFRVESGSNKVVPA